MLMEHQARKFANTWVEERKLGVESVAKPAVETERSWLFFVGGDDDEVDSETVVLAVEKLRGGVTRPHGAWLEFVDQRSALQRFSRWWNRMKY